MKFDPSTYWEQRYSGPLDLTRSGHADFPESYNRWLYRRKQAVLKRSLQRIGFSMRDKRLLEIGAGLGAYVDFWKRCGLRDFLGLELSQSATEFLRGRYPDFAFRQRDITQPGLKAECGGDFELAAALDVLYHVVDDALLEAALRNIAEVLQPGGVFAVHDQFLHRPSEHHGYLRWRSLAHWQGVLDAAGFDIVLRAPIFFVMIQPTDCSTSRSMARMDRIFDVVHTAANRWPTVAGPLAYAVDTACGALMSEGSSMELLLARRRK